MGLLIVQAVSHSLRPVCRSQSRRASERRRPKVRRPARSAQRRLSRRTASRSSSDPQVRPPPQQMLHLQLQLPSRLPPRLLHMAPLRLRCSQRRLRTWTACAGWRQMRPCGGCSAVVSLRRAQHSAGNSRPMLLRSFSMLKRSLRLWSSLMTSLIETCLNVVSPVLGLFMACPTLACHRKLSLRWWSSQPCMLKATPVQLQLLPSPSNECRSPFERHQ